MQVAEKAKRSRPKVADIISFSIGVPNSCPPQPSMRPRAKRLTKDSGPVRQATAARTRCSMLPGAHSTRSGWDGYAKVNVATGIGAST
jgi:hypothetical protein